MKNKLQPTDIDQIIKLYTETQLGQDDLGKMFKVNASSIRYWLLSKNIPLKPRKTGQYQKYPFDENFFLSETPESAYLYGFALGDGCLHRKPEKNTYLLSLQVNLIDRCILEKFCEWTKRSSEAIGTSKSLCQLRFSSTNIFKDTDFSKWGLVPNKTYNAVAPTITDATLTKHFIVGLLDADGHISSRMSGDQCNRITLTCNQKIIKWFKKTLNSICPQIAVKTYLPKEKCWGRAVITGIIDLKNFCDILNVKHVSWKLSRKWDKLNF